MKSIFLFLMLIPSLAFAWSGTGEVTAVYSHAGDHVIRSTIASNACSSGAFWWPADGADAKDMFSLALTALVSGKKISVVYNSNDSECRHGNSAKISHMVIYK